MDYLAHGSLCSGLAEIRPGRRLQRVYATNNFHYAIKMALKKRFPIKAIRLNSYIFFNTRFEICSIAGEYFDKIKVTPVTLYFFSKENFSFYSNISSGFSDSTFNIFSTYGEVRTSGNPVRPVFEISFTLDQLFFFGMHAFGDSKKIIFLKFFITMIKNRVRSWIKRISVFIFQTPGI